MLLLVTAFCFIASAAAQLNPNNFTADFLFGIATAAYQVEGAWNIDGKGENIWDRLTHDHPEFITDGSNGDIACDSYHKFREDVQLAKSLGVNYYRFSISWARVLPKGFGYFVNQAGIDFYNNLINELIANGLEPMVTLYHWELPQTLQDQGGWPNSYMIDYFEDYARLAFETFGDRVKYWVTFNEPKQTCMFGYGSLEMAPALEYSGIADYQCTHNLLKAHARTYHLYNDTFRPTQNGKIGFALDMEWYEANSTSSLDLEAQDRSLQFIFGWFANPVFNGDYPQVMKDRIAARSALEGFSKSRLPEFTPEEIQYINGTHDFLGFNFYSAYMVNYVADQPIGEPSFSLDLNVPTFQDPTWPDSAADWIKVTPWAFRNALVWIKNTFGNPDIYVTENGFADLGELNDSGRINYYNLYLSALLDAVYQDNVTVKGYTAWSLLDNFEWMRGYSQKFGMFHVDFTDPNRTRTEKASAARYRQIIANRNLN